MVPPMREVPSLFVEFLSADPRANLESNTETRTKPASTTADNPSPSVIHSAHAYTLQLRAVDFPAAGVLCPKPSPSG